MASTAKPHLRRKKSAQSSQAAKKTAVKKAEEDFLADVMVSVSASLEAMSEEDRERAVRAAERSVAHLR